jgi:Ca-activated chloride channel family protein
MSFANDPRLTAYALGEGDPTERAEVEALLANDPEARAAVDDIRRVSSDVGTALAGASVPIPVPAAVRGANIRRVFRAAAAVLVLGLTAFLGALIGRGGVSMERKSADEGQVWNYKLVPPQGDKRRELARGYGSFASGAPSVGGGGGHSIAGGAGPYPSGSPTRVDKLFAPSAGSGGGAPAPVVRRYADHLEVADAGAFVPGGGPRPQSAPGPDTVVLGPDEPGTEGYAALSEADFVRPQDAPLSTFSVDVDTASYANVRRFLTDGSLPPPGAVRLEELVNYFRYAYDAPKGSDPIAAEVEVASCPWNLEHRLVRIGVQTKDFERRERPPSNLTFLLDVSGSMEAPNKLPLVQESMRMLVNESLQATDRVSIVVYAGASGLVLGPTAGDHRADILAAIDRLSAGGSTNGAAGIELAYQTNLQSFLKGGNNRVILCTDGDFNVGVSDHDGLLRLIQEKAKSGIFLTALGYGMGNLKDDTLELLADKGNGVYGYVDGLREARRLLVEQAGSTLVTVAKDVKIQVEFNPLQVGSYRLLGYDDRRLAAQDFNDDRKDAGDMGAGHSVTALYEVVPPGPAAEKPAVDPLRYQHTLVPTDAASRNEMLTVKLRWKEPDGETSRLMEVPAIDGGTRYENASPDFKFASAVAAFAMVLRNSPHKGNASYEGVSELAGEAVGADVGGYRREFLDLVQKARQLAGAK